jgi:hypothetical protein
MSCWTEACLHRTRMASALTFVEADGLAVQMRSAGENSYRMSDVRALDGPAA